MHSFVSVSATDTTVEYIRNQLEHHRKWTFCEEFKKMLRKHGFDFDDSMLN